MPCPSQAPHLKQSLLLATTIHSDTHTHTPWRHPLPAMTEYWDPDSEPDYIKGDLLFVKEPPEEIAIECSICFHVMWKEPSLTSCGHHFCTSCIVVAQENNRPCPKCKAKYYDIFIDADRQRYICGLQIYCTNKKHGCNWKGKLQDLSSPHTSPRTWETENVSLDSLPVVMMAAMLKIAGSN